LQQGLRVRALVRDPLLAKTLLAQDVALVEGDLQNPEALQQLVADSSAVVHCAGAVRGGSQQDFDKVNVAGTAALLAAIESQAANTRLLLLSSLAAREPQLSWYAHSKRDAETLLQESAELDWVIVRPPAVYGPGDKEMLPVFQTMARGLATVPGTAEARISLIHVDDLSIAIIACLQSGRAIHHTLSLCDGKPGGYDWHELAVIVGSIWGRRVRIWRVPAWLLNLVARCNLRLARITGSAPMLTPAKLRELRHSDWVVDNKAIGEVTGWSPTIDLRKGLAALRNSAL